MRPVHCVSASAQVSHECLRRLTEMPGLPQTMQRPPYVPKLHSSQMRTTVAGRTYESQMGLRRQRVSDVRQARQPQPTHHLPSHFSHRRPIAMPGSLRH